MAGAVGTAFVVGATGYTGREVVRALRARGIEAVAHVRPDSNALPMWQAKFGAFGASVDTTAWDEKAMTATMLRVLPTHVFALLGTTRKRANSAVKAGKDPADEGYHAIDYGLTALLLRACCSAGIRPRFVYLSSAGVSDTARGAYLQVRARLERELRASGLPYTIVRPSFITGPDRDEVRIGEKVAATTVDALLAFGALLGAKKTRARYASTNAKELATALVRHAWDAASENRIISSEELR